MDWTFANQQAYEALFDLEPHVFSESVLEYRCGLTTLNLSLLHVVSVDTLFHTPPALLKEQLHRQYEDTFADKLALFLQDYPQGVEQKRYLPFNPGPLPFEDFQFTLALSVYPFFRTQADRPLTLAQLRELTRVAKEVRLAPHQFEQVEVFNHLGPMMLILQKEEVGVEIMPLKAQYGLKNAVMLRLWAQSCRVR